MPLRLVYIISKPKSDKWDFIICGKYFLQQKRLPEGSLFFMRFAWDYSPINPTSISAAWARVTVPSGASNAGSLPLRSRMMFT